MLNSINKICDEDIESSSYGYCHSCRTIHYLKQKGAKEYCLDLMNTLEERGTIDIHTPAGEADPRLTLDYIKGEARGQMFGVLECLDADGKSHILKAFSGQYNGVWDVKGWAPPLFDPKEFDLIVGSVDKEIKQLGTIINNPQPGDDMQSLIYKRKRLSQELMKEIHSLYRVRNFRSEVRPLTDFFENGIPAGAGDCCGPKLLNAAAKMNLMPESLSEIFWGQTNLSGTRIQGNFYGPCREKCLPLIGFMLCGARADGSDNV
ncbi:MAG: hypothetical protein JW927_23410 [Deltaproteobacteria bacterium]|nr:hypothetical protein [Deltaproteobacteria bacterium]